MKFVAGIVPRPPAPDSEGTQECTLLGPQSHTWSKEIAIVRGFSRTWQDLIKTDAYISMHVSKQVQPFQKVSIHNLEKHFLKVTKLTCLSLPHTHRHRHRHTHTFTLLCFPKIPHIAHNALKWQGSELVKGYSQNETERGPRDWRGVHSFFV